MKASLLFILLSLVTVVGAQTTKPVDQRSQLEKEDPNDLYGESEISKLDLIEALELASIRIHKFDIGEFDKEYRLEMFADEYKGGEIVKTDTLVDFHTGYFFWIDGEPFPAYIDQVKVYTKTDESKSELNIRTYSFGTKKKIELSKEDDQQFFNWRRYKETKWELDKKVPMLVFASSWLDTDYDVHRFCGVVSLAENDEGTEELLSSSPNYIVISYKVSEMEE